jgi:hypothetical protein
MNEVIALLAHESIDQQEDGASMVDVLSHISERIRRLMRPPISFNQFPLMIDD